MLIEQGLGTYPFICVLDAAARGKPMPTMAYSQEQIDRLLPPERFSKANAEAEAPASLDIQIERHKAALGDSEDVLNAASTRKPRRRTCSSGRHQLR
jgi:hypothetical protein